MKILILTRSAWDDTNSLGNTMTNFWAGWDGNDIANIYCRAAEPNNGVCTHYYSIHEKDLLKSIFNRRHIAGSAFAWDFKGRTFKTENKDIENEKWLYDFFRSKSSVLAHWGQELLWKLGRWRNDTLNQFLYDFKPDIIFAPCFAAAYPHKLIWHIQERTNAKVVLFHADDYLTFKGLDNSILTRFNRKLRANTVIKSANKANLNYCISPSQQAEYHQKLKREMKLLYKGADFSFKPFYKRDFDAKLIRIIYIGSTQYGRWKTLGMLARAIQKIHADKLVFELLIYSQYQPLPEEEQTMVIKGSSRFMGKIEANEVNRALSDADIVLHVESFDETERLATRLSFSTKIVDCLHSNRCVMAIGWVEAASIDYLVKNDAALVANDEISIAEQLKRIINNPSIIEEYAQKGWDCGKRNHQIKDIQTRLLADLKSIL